MNDEEHMDDMTNRQLASAVEHIRGRLERYIQRTGKKSLPLKPGSSSHVETRSLIGRLLKPTSLPESKKVEPPGLSGDSNVAAQEYETPSTLNFLAQRLALSRFEQDILMLCAAMELNPYIATLCARAHDDASKPFPTFSLSMVLFDEPSWDALSPDRPLRYWHLLEINQPGAQPLITSALRIDDRIVNYIKGLNYIDDRLSLFLHPYLHKNTPSDLSSSQADSSDDILLRLQSDAGNGSIPVIQLVGPETNSKHLIAAHAAARLNRNLYRFPVEYMPANPADVETLSRLWERESHLFPMALYIDAEDMDTLSNDRLIHLNRFLSRSNGICFIGSREVVPRLTRPSLIIDAVKPDALEQEKAWLELLGSGSSDISANLAAQFKFDLPEIREFSQIARSSAASNKTSIEDEVWDVCCSHARPRLDVLAERLDPKMTWEDIVLPTLETNTLKQIASQVRQRNTVYQKWGFARKMNRGFSISALFAGDSGTGKTMAAEVIANELRLNLYRIDLSAVVNKYIGETEKNLRRVFDAAEDGGVILFFDEADALFGKRSEVKDSHDRYANIEINYLLQRLESYRGLAILATNMKNALDTAFIRRLRFVVNFPFPDVEHRRRLWEKALLKTEASTNLPSPPLGELDYSALARLNLVGGHIHNVALNAAFMAAALREDITMPLILSAARSEFVKLNRPVNDSDFKWSPPKQGIAHVPAKKDIAVPV